MIKAEKMFEELGYKKTINPIDERDIVYYRAIGMTAPTLHFKNFGVEIVSFNDRDIISIKLHKAIHQQMKELGWLG